MTRPLRLLIAVLAVAAVAAVAVGAVAARRAVRSLDQPLNVTVPVRFKVPAGARFNRVATELAAAGVIGQPRAWELYARWKGLASVIKAGEYQVDPGMTPRTLLDRLVSGQVLLHAFTIVDGWRVADLLQALRRNPDLTATPAVDPKHLMDQLGEPGLAAEGRFLPETYRFPAGTSDLELLRQAHAAMLRVLGAAWAARDPDIPLKSPEELLIMASIIEKESGLPEELPKIAGLYLHRLRIGMRLQADPTVIYGLGSTYDGSLHAVDLRTDGPYNSYTRSGLPPTPIALPGAAAIEATAHPQSTDALYFVASGRGDGSHVFSATLQQHTAAVAEYLARQRLRAASESAR